MNCQHNCQHSNHRCSVSKLILNRYDQFRNLQIIIIVFDSQNCNIRLSFLRGIFKTRRTDTKEATLLSDDSTDFVSTDRLGHGKAYQKLASTHSSKPYMAESETQIIFYDMIHIVCLVYQISMEIKEYLGFIDDRWRNWNDFMWAEIIMTEQPFCKLVAKMMVIGCRWWICNQSVGTKLMRSVERLKGLALR